MTQLRESVAAALEQKVRAAFTEGETEAGSSKTYNRVGVRNLPLNPQEMWHRLAGILDSLPGVAPAQPFKTQAINAERLEITGAISDHAKENATVTIITISYWVRDGVGDLKISLLWTPKEHRTSPVDLELPPPKETTETMPKSRAAICFPQILPRSSPRSPYSNGHA